MGLIFAVDIVNWPELVTFSVFGILIAVPAAPSAAPEQEKGKEEYKDSKAITEPISFGQQKLASMASGGGQVIGVACFGERNVLFVNCCEFSS
ncbi:hypothetical protein Pyn_08035 [Prunus yedoensis var. nudiflora]|uniref:Uncharacterized protein n=1 Tax=Prunus yedoensis var. nudiflora TaxID=2094558 RepID=A0A314ZDT4_PRUYE|nr:hypothetical protein Pyn_08035 [Prunus yedoensis var. nudiflora]